MLTRTKETKGSDQAIEEGGELATRYDVRNTRLQGWQKLSRAGGRWVVRAGKDGKRKAERKGQERKKEEEQEGLKERERMGMMGCCDYNFLSFSLALSTLGETD
ncbi:hypothetical protein An01g10390 [Aspergillus niger]|uniref:Uncharacterized protein n=2 Tax=Aspergillus niger TaxID=5061 RepID=A2QA68_ASPNC|nr:hypothetical protein An01g10390 [Aspergillus niger]CAK37220.1 hypothetical protein An01g10390 [Aspergillus niger]